MPNPMRGRDKLIASLLLIFTFDDSLSGAFLVPFFIFMVIEGIPLFFIELGIGQRFRKTSIEAWGGIHRGLQGIGVSCLIISSMLCVYYVIVISWCCYYFFISFTDSLPWQKKYCSTYGNYTMLMKKFKNATYWRDKNVTVNVDIPKLNNTVCSDSVSRKMKLVP